MTLTDALPNTLLPWHDFFVLTGTAAATLIGLMFVAVTFGSSLVTRETAEGARAFLDPTYTHFAEVLLIACTGVAPSLPPSILGALLLIVGGWRLVGLRGVFIKYRAAHQKHGDIEASDWVTAIALPLVCHVLLMVTGGGFLQHTPIAPTGLAVVMVALLLIGIQGAWELLMWMALAVAERQRAGGQPPRSSSD
jgi:hypothetical protein